MKTKFTLLGLFICIASNAVAQPTFNMNDIGHQVGDVIEVDSTEYVDLSGQVGANMTWDLSALPVPDNTFEVEVFNSPGNPGSDNFPGSNLVRKVSFESNVLYQYLDQSANQIQYMGNHFEIGGFETTTIHSNPELFLETPLTYGSSGADTHAFELFSDFTNSTVTGASEYEVVGYGTLLMNGNTYADCLLARIQRWDTLTSTFMGIDFVSYDYDDGYTFMKAGIHFPLASFSAHTTSSDFEPPNTTFDGSILTSQSVGVDQLNLSIQDVQVYPNPNSSGDVNLHFSVRDKEMLKVELYDIQGKSLSELRQQQPYVPGEYNLQFEIPTELESGFYLIRIIGDKNVHTEILSVEK